MKVNSIYLVVCYLLILLLLALSLNSNEKTNIIYQNNYVEQTPYRIYKVKNVNITSYNPTKEQCDDTPDFTASNVAVRLGIVAVSYDLIKKFHLHFGTYVYIDGYGLFEFQDTMNYRIKNTIDILCWNSKTSFNLTTKKDITFIEVNK